MSSTPFDNNGIPLTQPSQASQTQEPLEPEDNYVDSTSNDFCTRLKFWMDTVQHLYPIQLAVIYKAGVTVNLNLLNKEPKRLKEVATKYKAVMDELRQRGTISASEYEKMKKMKHLSPEPDTVEVQVPGWPSGKSIWDRYVKSRRLLQKDIVPKMPTDLKETPSGQGLRM